MHLSPCDLWNQCAQGLQVPPLTLLSCGSYTHMPAIQSFGVCADICVCVKINGCLFGCRTWYRALLVCCQKPHVKTSHPKDGFWPLESLTHLWDCVSSLQLSFYYGSRKFESKENIESKSTTVKKNGQLTTAKQNMVPSMVILKNDCNIVHILGGKRIKRWLET